MRPVPQQLCLGLLHAFEGKDGKFEATRAQDPGGLWEIGWSHRLTGVLDPLWNATLDAVHSDILALKDLTDAAGGLCAALSANVQGPTVWDADAQKMVPGPAVPVYQTLTEGQYGALIDFTYNVGVATFRASTLCHYINTQNMTLAPGQFGLWVHGKVNGIETVLPGLVRRRAAEVAAWNAPNP